MTKKVIASHTADDLQKVVVFQFYFSEIFCKHFSFYIHNAVQIAFSETSRDRNKISLWKQQKNEKLKGDGITTFRFSDNFTAEALTISDFYCI